MNAVKQRFRLESNAMTRIVRRNLSHAVSEELLHRIQDGTFKPGDRLPTEASLMEMFSVGRNTIREAVHVLAARGVVDVRPGQGTTVLAVSGSDAMDSATLSALLDEQALSDLYEFRLLLEVEIAGRAAKRALPAQIDVIERRVADFLHASQADQPTWSEDIAFHRAVAEASGNVIYVAVLDAVTDRLAAARRQTQLVPGAVEVACSEHRAIFDAIKRNDPDAARAAMATHIQSAIWALEQVQKTSHHADNDASPAAE